MRKASYFATCGIIRDIMGEFNDDNVSTETLVRQLVDYRRTHPDQPAKAVPDADIRLAAFTRRVVQELSDSPKSALLQLADAIKAIDGDTQE